MSSFFSTKSWTEEPSDLYMYAGTPKDHQLYHSQTNGLNWSEAHVFLD